MMYLECFIVHQAFGCAPKCWLKCQKVAISPPPIIAEIKERGGHSARGIAYYYVESHICMYSHWENETHTMTRASFPK